ncbi:hypothetical protein CLIB1423_03S04478 [[Candida] railenensis]|uniref:Uncharacterized protein n=1 Tax=[Candida] railenensis TaxID=45579 RepID=A0A9P0QMD3_9ASCO|nr:hypothetical protein CLIB1423_03S04478 [[Candida] railenensis]
MSKSPGENLEASRSNPLSHYEENEHIADDIVSRIEEEREEITDDEDAEEFIRKYGDINFKYIKRPKDAVWFIRPHALNYFKDGVLYRTKGERTSSKTELFLDLMYVGIIANLAGTASENASGAALLKYVLTFVPAWTVWADIKDFTNYYYNEDLSQKLYIMWILALLTLYVNSQGAVLESREGAAYTIVPYIMCRMSLALSLLLYSFYIPEHRPQQRLYACFITFTCCLWIPVIFISTRAKIGLSITIMVLENVLFMIAYHPYTKRVMNLRMSTALNIEHEVERFATFVTIAIGEFLYKAVATGGLGVGFSDKFARGIFLIMIAYTLFWIYNNGSTVKCATHALRRNGFTACIWIYAHLPLVAALVLAADAGGDITLSDTTSLAKTHSSTSEEIISSGEEHSRRSESSGEEEHNMYALSLFFTGSLCVALVSLAVLGLLDESKDPKDMFIIPRFWRVIMRVPVGIIILCLSFAELQSTVLMGIVVALLVVLLVFESFTSTPKNCLNITRPINLASDSN